MRKLIIEQFSLLIIGGGGGGQIKQHHWCSFPIILPADQWDLFTVFLSNKEGLQSFYAMAASTPLV